MASTIDVAPTIGHALIATQLGIGSTPGYDAVDLRRVTQAGWQAGVHDPTGWQVGEHTPNALSVDVQANVGLATVQGTTVTGQGLYVVSPHSAVATLTFATADATNPRIDQIILHAYDTTHDGSGLNKASIEVLAGTPTAGATLANRNGAAALPANAIRLADVLVGAGATVVTNSVIRDRRPWANGASWRGIKGSTTTINVGSDVAIGTANLQARIECSGAPVLVVFSGVATGGSTAAADVGFWIDGSPADAGEYNAVRWLSATFTAVDVGFSSVVLPAAGSRLFTAIANASGNSWTMSGAATFAIREFAGAGWANNGNA